MAESAVSIKANVVQLSAVPIHGMAEAVRTPLYEKFGIEKHQKGFPDYEWRRFSFVLRKIKRGHRCLEVGPGRYYFTKMLSKSKKFESIMAVDIVEPNRAIPASVQFMNRSIADIDLPDGYFDTVICMEVLEHLEDKVFEAGLKCVRRVCGGQLFITLPFNEPTPLPKYHRQAFDQERILKTFPDARFTLLTKEPVTRVPWILIEENFAQPRAKSQ